MFPESRYHIINIYLYIPQPLFDDLAAVHYACRPDAKLVSLLMILLAKISSGPVAPFKKTQLKLLLRIGQRGC